MKKIITMCLLFSLFSSLVAQRQLTIESEGIGNTVHVEALDNSNLRDLLELQLPEGTTDAEQFIECQEGPTVVAKINQLKPARYYYKRLQHKSRKSIGLIAQEVQEVFPDLVRELNTDEKTGENYLGVAYNSFIPIIIKGMQEQQALIETLQTEKAASRSENMALQGQVQDLNQKVRELYGLVERMTALETNLQSCCLNHQNSGTSDIEQESVTSLADRAQLQQNFPNPFNQQTEIQYYLPNAVKVATLQISDLNGKLLETYLLPRNGVGKVVLDGGQLAEGMYIYSLVVDGQLVDSKQMVLTK